MDIVYASSDSYSEVVVVSIVSLLENNRDISELNIYLIENHISDNNKERLKATVAAYGRTLHLIPIPNIEKFVGISIPVVENISTFNSCFLSMTLPKNLDKVLLLDCDTLILQSLQELWNTDISDYYMAGGDDVKSRWYRRALGMQDDSPYVNAGVMLINLKKWREVDVPKKVVDMLVWYGGKVAYEDQGILNAVLEPNILLLHPKYNCLSSFVCFDYKRMLMYRKPVSCFSEEMYDEAVNSPVIVHYSNNLFLTSRPWFSNCEHKYKDIYMKYREMTFAAEYECKARQLSITTKFAHLFYCIAPKALVAGAGGFLQAYIQPMMDLAHNFFHRRITENDSEKPEQNSINM